MGKKNQSTYRVYEVTEDIPNSKLVKGYFVAASFRKSKVAYLAREPFMPTVVRASRDNRFKYIETIERVKFLEKYRKDRQ